MSTDKRELVDAITRARACVCVCVCVCLYVCQPPHLVCRCAVAVQHCSEGRWGGQGQCSTVLVYCLLVLPVYTHTHARTHLDAYTAIHIRTHVCVMKVCVPLLARFCAHVSVCVCVCMCLSPVMTHFALIAALPASLSVSSC